MDDMMDDDLKYHTDTVTMIMPSCLGNKAPNGSSMLSSGRDGSIFEVDCLTREYTRVY